MRERVKVVILDRDGVINREQGHITSLEAFQVLEGVYEAIALLHRSGIKVCVASNQSGLARGILTEDTLDDIQTTFEQTLAKYGGKVSHWFYSPWHPDKALKGGVEQWLGSHEDRKPNPGMLSKALAVTGVGVDEAVMIGDSSKDKEAAKALGMRFVGIKSSKVDELMGEEVYDSLSIAVDQLFPFL